MKSSIKFLVLGILSSALLIGCSANETSTPTQVPEKVVDVPEFNADTAYHYVQWQVDFGPRIPNSEAHKQAGEALGNKFRKFGAEVIEQEFTATSYDGVNLELKNIIASFKPEASKRILLAAHWDTRPWASKDPVDKTAQIDGANDGASGVAVLLEIARQLKNNELPEVGIDMILFDGEDWGQENGGQADTWCLGSQHWAANKHEQGYSAYYGILLDMVGGRNAQFRYEGYSYQTARKILDKVWRRGNSLGYSRYFIPERASSITDDHYYVNSVGKIPMIDILHYDPVVGYFGDFHHTTADNMDFIDKNTLKAVGQTVLAVIYHE